MTEHMPDDRARTLRIVGVALAGALGTALIAAGIWMALRPEPTAPQQTEIEPAEQTEPQTPTAAPVTPDATATTDAQGGASAPGTPTGDGTGIKPGGISPSTNPEAPKRAAKVAYRLDSSIYIANEDGSDAQALIESAGGPYALSPDAETLAYVSGGRISLIDAAGGDAKEVAPAAGSFVPCWLADSSRVVYRRRATGTPEGSKLFSAARAGGKPDLLAPGREVAISADGAVVVVLATDELMTDGSAYVQVARDGAEFKPVRVQGGMPTAVATNGERIFVAVMDGEGGSAIISMKPDGRDAKQVVGPVPGSTRVLWGSVRPSPEGDLLALAAQGDDGYSRTFVVSSSGGTPIALATRRDSYLHGWSAAGDRLFLIEGNTFQGETTSLVSVARNGTGRRILVPGAE